MRKNKRNILAVLGLATALSSGAANAGVYVGVLGGWLYTIPVATGVTASGGYGYDAGAEFGFGNGRVGGNISAAYFGRTMNVSGTVPQLTGINGSGAFRLMLGKIFYIDLGGYFNYLLTHPAPLAATMEYGPMAGLGLQLPLGKSVAFFVQGRFHYSFGDLTTSAASTYYGHYVAVNGGFRFGGMEGK